MSVATVRFPGARLASTLRFVTGHPLTRRRRVAAIARYLGWQLKSRISRDVEFQWIGGARLIARRGMTGATGNIYCGLHEFAEMAFLLHLLRPGDLFVDVGANIGSYTVLASKVCGARSVAFEPDQQTAAHLRRNLTVNGLDHAVVVHQTALGSDGGEIRFSVGLDTMNHANPRQGLPAQIVPVQSLDSVEGVHAPVFIKLDVEGFEEQVLAGAARTLAARSLLAVQSELQGSAVDGVLEPLGFARAYYDPFTRELTDRGACQGTSNALYVRDFKTVAGRVREAPRRRILGTWI